MSNELTFNQVSTLLNQIQQQATGQIGLTPTNTSEFVTVGQKVLKTGYDTVLGAISQVLTKTLFSVRPYEAKFKGLVVSNQRFGAISRKLSISDKEFVDDDRQNTSEGNSLDMYIVRKPNILELNYYGFNVWSDYITIYKDQLDHAFTGPDELGSFLAMVMQNLNDKAEQARENMARATVANYIGGKIESDNSVIHLLTEYNALTGLTLTKADVYKPENYKDFMQWVSGRVEELSSLMTERSELFHINVTGKEVKRHTPMSKQKMYLLAENKFGIQSRVLADQFHNTYMKLADNETVNFWQSITTPDTIDVKPIYLGSDGTLSEAAASVQTSDVFGVMFDEEAMGITYVNQWMQATPFNARGGYSNMWMHETKRFWTDYTENGIVLLLD